MKDVVAILRRYIIDEAELCDLITELGESDTAQRNIIFAEFIRRIRKAAGIAAPIPAKRGDLLEWLDSNS